MCIGLRGQWEDVHLQDLQDGYGQEWVSRNGRVKNCQHKREHFSPTEEAGPLCVCISLVTIGVTIR